MNRKALALGRMKSGRMNDTEFAYSKVLELRKMKGEILWYAFEGVRLQLAPNTTFTPDFIVMLSDGVIEFHEVKGFWQDDAKVKIKVAAEKYPFRFIAVRYNKKQFEQIGEW